MDFSKNWQKFKCLIGLHNDVEVRPNTMDIVSKCHTCGRIIFDQEKLYDTTFQELVDMFEAMGSLTYEEFIELTKQKKNLNILE